MDVRQCLLRHLILHVFFLFSNRVQQCIMFISRCTGCFCCAAAAARDPQRLFNGHVSRRKNIETHDDDDEPVKLQVRAAVSCYRGVALASKFRKTQSRKVKTIIAESASSFGANMRPTLDFNLILFKVKHSSFHVFTLFSSIFESFLNQAF